MQMQQQLAAQQQQQMNIGYQMGTQPNFQAAGVQENPAQMQEKKQREIYVGNLAIGVVNEAIVEEFFNQALSHMVSDPVATPPVIHVKMDGQGRFAFVELRTRDLANQAVLMDKLVEIYGRQLHVGRPKGYIEDYNPESVAPDQTIPTLNLEEAKVKPTCVLLLSNILTAADVGEQKDRTAVGVVYHVVIVPVWNI